MAKIEGIRIKNFRGLKNITLGMLWSQRKFEPLTPMTIVIGKNGVGKSTLFDAFGFLADSLKEGVEEACNKRGGFDRIRSQGQTGAIEFEIYYKENGKTNALTYDVSINADKYGRPFVEKEQFKQRRDNQKHGWAFKFLDLKNGKGVSWKGEGKNGDEESKEMEVVELVDKRKFGIATLGALKQHPRIAAFRQFMENWYLSYFTPDAARNINTAGAQPHLNSKSDNLANVVEFMENNHKDKLQTILNSIAEKIPGINTIKTYRDPINKNLYLLFNDKGFGEPFYQLQMSDGTLKVFAYLLLLIDPNPPPLICIEEPENGLYHKLLETLATEFRRHATNEENSTQLFITTHQPYFVDVLDPEEVWVLEKGEDGFSTITRASEIPYVQNMVNEGQPLGALWYSDYLDAR